VAPALVTGAPGFIGSARVAALRALGGAVVPADLQPISDSSRGAVVDDLRDPAVVEAAFEVWSPDHLPFRGTNLGPAIGRRPTRWLRGQRGRHPEVARLNLGARGLRHRIERDRLPITRVRNQAPPGPMRAVRVDVLKARSLGYAPTVELRDVSCEDGVRCNRLWSLQQSFGLGAMRFEVAIGVDLRVRRFDASELLVGAAIGGFRVVEVHATVHQCAARRSRKGNDLIYGARFGWVVLSRSWREPSRHPR
jgi:hypothetical protein